MQTKDTPWRYGVEPAEGVRFETALDNGDDLAAVVVVEPNWDTWLWDWFRPELSAKLDTELMAVFQENVNVVYVMTAEIAGWSEPLFPEMWSMAQTHVRGWEPPGRWALRQLRRWLDGLSAEIGGGRPAPVAVVGAVLEAEVLWAANAVTAAGWPAVVLRDACLSANRLDKRGSRPEDLRREVERLMNQAKRRGSHAH